eukprot:7431648-Pyramimonas_sp.AAC.1
MPDSSRFQRWNQKATRTFYVIFFSRDDDAFIDPPSPSPLPAPASPAPSSSPSSIFLLLALSSAPVLLHEAAPSRAQNARLPRSHCARKLYEFPAVRKSPLPPGRIEPHRADTFCACTRIVHL